MQLSANHQQSMPATDQCTTCCHCALRPVVIAADQYMPQLGQYRHRFLPCRPVQLRHSLHTQNIHAIPRTMMQLVKLCHVVDRLVWLHQLEAQWHATPSTPRSSCGPCRPASNSWVGCCVLQLHLSICEWWAAQSSAATPPSKSSVHSPLSCSPVLIASM